VTTFAVPEIQKSLIL